MFESSLMRTVPPINICSQCIPSNVGLFNTNDTHSIGKIVEMENIDQDGKSQTAKQHK